jgi:glycerol dehydrogenase-like iron-containing ADH family enzyme
VAKYYETSAYVRANPDALANPSVRAAYALTSEIMRLASECAVGAVDAVSKGKITRDFRRSVYLNIVLPGLVSGIGGKKCRAVAAHALCNGLGHAPGARGSLHGERVGWGLLVQAVLEGKKKDARRIKIFLSSIGAPTTLNALGVTDTEGPGMKKALAVALSPRESMRFLGRKISVPELAGAVRAVEKL